MNPEDVKGYLSEDIKQATLRDAVDFLPTTYISDEDKIKVAEYLNELFECKKELEEIVAEGKTFPVECQFCDTIYEFTPEDVRKLIANS